MLALVIALLTLLSLLFMFPVAFLALLLAFGVPLLALLRLLLALPVAFLALLLAVSVLTLTLALTGLILHMPDLIV